MQSPLTHALLKWVRRLTLVILHIAVMLWLQASASAAPRLRDYAYDLSGRLHRVMDDGGTLLTYGYDALGNIVSITRDQIDPDFNVLSTVPQTGSGGDLVTVQGNGFDPNIAGNDVDFGGVAGTVVSVDPSGRTLVVRVPWGAQNGPIGVTVNGQTTLAPDDFTAVNYGDAGIPGTLARGASATYQVPLLQGQSIQVRLADSTHNAFVPNLVLKTSSGTSVTSGYGADVAALSYTATSEDTFDIVVSDRNGTNTGDFVLYYTVAPGSNEGGTLSPDNPSTGTIDLGDLDSYTFDVQAGVGVQLRVADTSNTAFVPYLVVYNPSGAVVSYVQGASVAAASFTASVAGTYTAVVFDNSSGYASSGNYKIYYTVAPGSNEGGALDPNNPIAGTIDLGDLDSFTFDVQAGVGVQLRVADTANTAFVPYLVVYNPSGAIVSYVQGGAVAATSFNASVSGRYTAIVHDSSSGYASTGDYNIYYTVAPGSNKGGALDPNNPVAGTIDLGDLDSYTFDVQAGVGVQLRVADTGNTAFVPYLVVYNPSGAVVSYVQGTAVAATSFNASVSGRYTAIVHDSSSGYASTGDYNIYYTVAPGSNESGTLDPDNPISGTIDLGDLDSYTFDVNAGEGVQLRVADTGNTTFVPYLVVYNPSGVVVSYVQGGAVAATSFNASVSGQYTAIVHDSSSGYASTGDYNIYYTVAPGSNESGTLDPDNPISGTIDLGDLDSYTFDVQAGEGVQLRVADTGNTAFVPYLVVYNPSGAVVSYVQGGTVAATSFNATASGKYTAIVHDSSSGYASTGNYNIYYTVAPGSNEAGTLDSNAPIAGTIDVGDLDSYTFDAATGDGIRLRIADVGATALYPYVVVYAPNGAVLAYTGGYDVANVALTAAATGTFTVVVYDGSSGNAATGDYNIYFTHAPGSNEGGLLDPDAPIAGTIDLGDLDSFTFNVATGDGVRLRLADVGATALYPYFTIYDPNGTVVANAGNDDVANAAFTPTVGGTYTVVVLDGSSGSASIGDYEIYYTQAPGSNDGGVLDPNVPIDGRIDLGDLDSYTFDVAVGNGVRIRVSDVGATALYPYVTVYDPNGTVVANAGNYDVANVAFNPSVAGTYTAVVLDGSSGSAETGDYKIYFTQAPTSNEGGLLDPNVPIDGTIELGDLDSYTFDATTGDQIRIRVADVGATGLYPYFTVYDPNGTAIANGGNYDVADVAVRASISGVYTVVVLDGSNGSAAIGDYKIYFTQVPGSDESGDVDPNSPIDGIIDLGDMDSYTLDLAVGQGALVRVADVGATSLYPYAIVYDPNGTVVATGGNYDVAAMSFNPAVAGTYTVVVLDGSSGSAASGAYKLYVSAAGISNEGGVLTSGSVITDTIDLGDLDSFTFSAAAGDRVQVTAAEPAATGLYPWVVVYGPTGAVISNVGGALTATASFTAAAAGTYTAVVLDASSGSAASGPYSISLTIQ